MRECQIPNLDAYVSISTNMESPPGIPSFFFLAPRDNGFIWERDPEKECEDYFETHDMYLNTYIYNMLASWEICCAEDINVSHWNFFVN